MSRGKKRLIKIDRPNESRPPEETRLMFENTRAFFERLIDAESDARECVGEWLEELKLDLPEGEQPTEA